MASLNILLNVDCVLIVHINALEHTTNNIVLHLVEKWCLPGARMRNVTGLML